MDQLRHHLDFSDPEIVKTHNCYDYAIGHLDITQTRKTHPGISKFGNNLNGKDVHSCQQMELRLQSDHPELITTDLNNECPKDYSKIGMMIDPEEDYHLIREDGPGRWSHKPGASKPTDRDFSGNLITDPSKADFNYKEADLNYVNMCGYYCIHENGHFENDKKNVRSL